jgi:hypothetical protein
MQRCRYRNTSNLPCPLERTFVLMYTLSNRNKKDVPVADIRMESVYCMVFIKNIYFDVLRVVTLRHFEFSKTRTINIESNKWADLQKPAVPFKVTVRAVLNSFVLFLTHVLLFFF